MIGCKNCSQKTSFWARWSKTFRWVHACAMQVGRLRKGISQSRCATVCQSIAA